MAVLQYRTVSNRTVAAMSVERDTVFWDRELTGSGVRVYPTGGKVFVAQARGPDGPKRVTVGRHPVLAAEQARQRAALIIARVKAGEDPVPVLGLLGHTVGVVRDLVLLDQACGIVAAEGVYGVPAFERPETQIHQNTAGELKARMEGIAYDVGDAEVHQRIGVLAVTRAGEDRQVGEVLAHRPRRRKRAFDIPDREHEEHRLVGLRGTQQFHAARVAVVDPVAKAAHEVDLFGAGLKRGEADAADPQDPAHDLADPAEPGRTRR